MVGTTKPVTSDHWNAVQKLDTTDGQWKDITAERPIEMMPAEAPISLAGMVVHEENLPSGVYDADGNLVADREVFEEIVRIKQAREVKVVRQK